MHLAQDLLRKGFLALENGDWRDRQPKNVARVDDHSHLVHDGLGTGSLDTLNDLLSQLRDVAIRGVEAIEELIISPTEIFRDDGILMPRRPDYKDLHDTDLGLGRRDVQVGGSFSDSGHCDCCGFGGDISVKGPAK